MMQDTSATGGTSEWQPVCPLCGRLGYGWHEGTTTHDAHYFSPPPFYYPHFIEEAKKEIAQRQDDRIKII